MRRNIWPAAFVCLLAGTPAFADTRDDVMAAMQRCSAMADDRTWLDCTYGAQQLMRAKLGLPPAPAYQQHLVPQPPLSANAVAVPQAARDAAAPVHRKGSFIQILGGTAPPVAVSILTAVTFNNEGAFTVTLQNGQVWHQLNVGSDPKWHLKIGTRVTIAPGALWTYNLKTDDDPHPYKVERKT